MRPAADPSGERFRVELIKPSHYDDGGYVIQWLRARIPSNSLACLYGLALDAARRRVLGDGVEILVDAHDETNTVIPTGRIIRRIRRGGGRGIVCLVGVQSNQFPRALDLARRFRGAGLPVAIGGFHVSGCLAMLPGVPAELREALDLGVTLYAGEAEGRFGEFLADAYHRRLRPIYNHLDDLPGLRGQVAPFLPKRMVKRHLPATASFDAGRGCPFRCSFCTIINVQGRKSRHRDADDVERLLRAHLAQGITDYFITDDNFARNKDWEAIFDRIGDLREAEGVPLSLIIQVDTLCHTIPRFVDKAARAGVRRVFIGLESINPDNLLAANKRQNRITEYRRMLQAWRRKHILTIAGYILGFPADTPARIREDIAIIQRELPVDLLEFFCLTPLPGSEDHQVLHAAGVPMDPDLNIYDSEHVCTGHPRMSREEWQGIYREAWDLFYSFDHIETLMRRMAANGDRPGRIALHVLNFHGSIRYERAHPLQGGFFRRKVRTERRPGLPIESPLVFYPRRAWEIVSTYAPLAVYAARLALLCRRVKRSPGGAAHADAALTPVAVAEEEDLALFAHTEAARAAVARARALASRRREGMA